MNPQIITLTGDVGSGKSTVGKLVAARLGWPYLSTGTLQREIARRRGLTTLELNRASMGDRAVDDTIDNRLRSIEQSRATGVVDARLGWFFIPRSFKVFLSVDPREGARRTFAARRAEEEHRSEPVTLRENIARRQLENERFRTLYGAECSVLSNYDLLVDTTYVDAGTVAETVLGAQAAPESSLGKPRCLLNPRRLLPTEHVRAISSAACGGIETAIREHGVDALEPVRVIATEWFFILADGHKRTSCALRLGLPLIPCATVSLATDPALRGLSARQFVQDRLDRGCVHAWEAAHGFRFLSYPDAALNVADEGRGSSDQ